MRLRCRSSACRASWRRPSRRPWPRAAATGPEPRLHLLRSDSVRLRMWASPLWCGSSRQSKQPACQRHPESQPRRSLACRLLRPVARPTGSEADHGQQTPAPRLVHELHARRVGPSAVGGRLALGRQVLRGHGAGAGARLLRLHHDRGHADGVRSLRRQRRGRAEARLAGAEARSVAARRDHQRGDAAAGGRGDVLDPGLSAVDAGAAVLHAGPHRRRPVRLEHRHVRRGRGGAEFRHGQAAAARAALRHGRRICRSGLPVVRFLGPGRGGDGPGDRHLRRLPQGPADRFRGQVLQGARAAEHGAVAAGAAGIRAGGRLAARAGVRGEACGLDHRHRQRHRGHEGISRRRAPPRGRLRAQSGRHQGAVPGLSRSSPRPTRRPMPSANGWCPRRRSSSGRWPASPP